jgi:hypothetical protein
MMEKRMNSVVDVCVVVVFLESVAVVVADSDQYIVHICIDVVVSEHAVDR